MALAITPVVNHPTYKSWTLTGDGTATTTTFAHGFASIPDDVHVNSQILSATTAATGWAVTVNATNITVTCASAAVAAPVGKVCAWLPHSIN
jgi:hypothetical protein